MHQVRCRGSGVSWEQGGQKLALKGLTFVGLNMETDNKVTNNKMNAREKRHDVHKQGKESGREWKE